MSTSIDCKEFGIWNLEFIKTLDAKEPRALLTKGRSTENSAVPVFIPERIGRERAEVYYYKTCLVCGDFYASLGSESLILFF